MALKEYALPKSILLQQRIHSATTQVAKKSEKWEINSFSIEFERTKSDGENQISN
jgi:hypothetical protein